MVIIQECRAFFRIFLCHIKNYALLCGVQILLRYEAANIAAFFVPIYKCVS
nr:MAG TPA: hypothetical protein [Bacteriophage sp.]